MAAAAAPPRGTGKEQQEQEETRCPRKTSKRRCKTLSRETRAETEGTRRSSRRKQLDRLKNRVFQNMAPDLGEDKRGAPVLDLDVGGCGRVHRGYALLQHRFSRRRGTSTSRVMALRSKLVSVDTGCTRSVLLCEKCFQPEKMTTTKMNWRGTCRCYAAVNAMDDA